MASSALICAGTALLGQGVSDTELSRTINAGNVAGARAALDGRGASEIDRAFLEARILKSQGQLQQAIDLLRQILERDPTYLNARRELAHSLLIAEQYSPSARLFRELLRTDQNAQMRAGYRQFLAIIERNRPFSLGGSVSLLPSSNVNRGASGTDFATNLGTFQIDQPSQEQSGVGLKLNVTAEVRPLVEAKRRLNLTAALAARRYDDPQFDDTEATVALQYEHSIGIRRYNIAPYLRQVDAEDAGYFVQGVSLGASQPVSAQNTALFQVVRELRRHGDQPNLDGGTTFAMLGVRRRVSDATTTTARVEIGRGKPQLDYQRYVSRALFLGIEQQFGSGLTVQGGLRLGAQNFSADFPQTGAPRADRYREVSVGFSHRDLDVSGLTPSVTCGHIVHMSNVALFDYESTDCALQLRRSF